MDGKAQRAHWKDVKKFSKPLTDRDDGLAQGRQWWGDKECSCLFENPTMMPFDDHDNIEKYGWALAKDAPVPAGVCNYFPLAWSLNKVQTDTSTWLT